MGQIAVVPGSGHEVGKFEFTGGGAPGRQQDPTLGAIALLADNGIGGADSPLSTTFSIEE